MEKHRCKLCYRRFSNGRALGGHMRSHMMNLHVPLKPGSQPSYELTSESEFESESESEPEEGEIVKEKVTSKSRKKFRKMVKVLDESNGGSSSVTLQDRGSDTESSKNVTRRRSKRSRKPATTILRNQQDYKLVYDDINSYYNEVEQQYLGSSISEVTSEEDVAICLMMMSRDTWSDNGHGHGHGHGYGYGYERDFSYDKNDDDDNDDVVAMLHKKKYKCETCNKVFRSYQALGGHRASHKKNRVTATDKGSNAGVAKEEEKKNHECPICFKVFGSGQALGGHKRSHVVGNGNNLVKSEVVQSRKENKIIDQLLIDLNLPAPIDDGYDQEFVTQFDTSTVSSAHL